MNLHLLVFPFLMVPANSSVLKDAGERTKRYKPDWRDLDTRPLPQWYDEAKIGIYLHWAFSVPYYTEPDLFWEEFRSGRENITTFIQKNYPPGYIFDESGIMITAEFFDPKEWAQLFQKAGAKYVIVIAKFTEGFTLFPSNMSITGKSFGSGADIDIVGKLAKAVRDQGLEFGIFYSLYERFNPLYWDDSDQNFTTCTYPVKKMLPELKQLVNDYKPSVIISHGDWTNTDSYWKSKELLAWLYNDSPVKDEVVVNDGWGIDTARNHGDVYHLFRKPTTRQEHKWENVFTLDLRAWSHRIDVEVTQIMAEKRIIETIVPVVSRGGNALTGIGPSKEGIIAPILQERLLYLGEWLRINGEAIYRSSPWHYDNDTINGNVWYTCIKTKYNAQSPTAPPNKNDTIKAIYAIFLKWPEDGILKLGAITPLLRSGNYQVELLGRNENKSFFKSSYLDCTITDDHASINLPFRASVLLHTGWTLKFTVMDYKRLILLIMIMITLAIAIIVIIFIIVKYYKNRAEIRLRSVQSSSLQPK